jgi:hypothetical protein
LLVRVRLSRSLFRKLAARAIEERTDVASVILRAVEADIPKRDRRECPPTPRLGRR